MAKQNPLTRTKKAKAEALFLAKDFEGAKGLYALVCQIDPLDVDAWARLGVVNRKLGEYAAAESCARKALSIHPKSAAAHLALGAALECQGQRASAILAYRSAVSHDSTMAEAHYFLANAMKEEGSITSAVEHYKKAIGLKPDFLEALSNIGAALTILNNGREAIIYLNRAYKLQPHSSQVLCNFGNVFVLDGRFEEALEIYQRALTYTPDAIDPIEKLATLYEKMNKLEEAKKIILRGLSLFPSNARLTIIEAKIFHREGKISEAIDKLKALDAGASLDFAIEKHLNLGKWYDQLGNSERAFRNISEGNRLRRPPDSGFAKNGQAYIDKVDYLAALLKAPCRIEGTFDAGENDSQPAPVFLIGFPRSGTTLLDQILDAHPLLTGLEEKPTVDVMINAFISQNKNGRDGFLDVTPEEIRDLRQIYYNAVDGYVKKRTPEQIIIDRLPLNTVNAHLIWRIFPNAKFIFAARHPCDVCLSCFMQNFVQSDAMSNFLTLESTASLYAKVMALWQRYTSTLPLIYHQIRYEDLVADFEGETRKLLDFIGVEWSDSVRGHTEHARTRVVNTASYNQVTQPIYQHAKYRWKRYEKELQPVMNILRPYIEFFGYGQ